MLPPEAQDLIRKALTLDPDHRISSKEFVEHEWFAKHGLYRRRATVPPDSDPSLDFQKTQSFASRNGLNSSNPLMARLGSRSVSREPTAHKEPPSLSYQSPKLFTHTAPSFYPKQQLPAPDQASQPNAQPASLYQQMRHENSSFNQTTQASFTASPSTPVRTLPPKPDPSAPLPDAATPSRHGDRRQHDSEEVVSTEMNHVRKTQTLQLKAASKAPDSLKLHTPSLSSTYSEARRLQPEVLVFTQTHAAQPVVISSNRQLPIAIFDQPSFSQASSRPDASPIHKAYGNRNTPIKDAIIHARDVSPTPTIPHGHFRLQASPDTSGISSRDPYRPLLTAKHSESGPLLAQRPPTDRE